MMDENKDMEMKDRCGRDSAGWLMWPGNDPTPMCSYHKEGPLRLARMMGWPVSFNVGDAGPCQSHDPYPDDEETSD